MVPTSTKFALNKRTLEKIRFHLSERIAFDRISISSCRKSYFHCLELEKMKKTGFYLTSVILSNCRKKLRIKTHSLTLAKNPYKLVVIKYLMKTPFPLAGKSYFHSQEYLQKSKKIISTSRNVLL